jgi:hypothetical protein
MVQFPASGFVHLCVQCTMVRYYPNRVTPFGNLRITGCVFLPAAFRNLLRPSSPDSPKASTMNPYSLDHIYRCIFIHPLLWIAVAKSASLDFNSRLFLRTPFPKTLCKSSSKVFYLYSLHPSLLQTIFCLRCQRTQLPTFAAITLEVQTDSLALTA